MQKVEKVLSYIKENKVYEAQKILVKKFKNKPGEFYYYLGLINLKRKDYTSAEADFKIARENNIESYLLAYNLSVCYMKMGNIELAKEELITTIKKEPLFLNSYINICNIYISEKNTKEAFRTIKYGQASLKDDEEKLKKLKEIEKKITLNRYTK